MCCNCGKLAGFGEDRQGTAQAHALSQPPPHTGAMYVTIPLDLIVAISPLAVLFVLSLFGK